MLTSRLPVWTRPFLDPLRHLKAWVLRGGKRQVHGAAFAPYEVPPGHFYSPLPALDDISRRSDALFVADAVTGDDLDLNEAAQLELLDQMAKLVPEFSWSEGSAPDHRFRLGNTSFEVGDAFALYALMRISRPRRVIEVGSGHSSALMLDVNERFLERRCRFVFIEPYPDRLLSVLRPGDHEVHELIRAPVQSVPLDCFRELGRDDILFIDSSHVCKVGSDVNYLVFEVLPALADGVLVHIHDIGWPFEYPREWVLKGRCWNEAYLIRAFLQYNEAFEIVLFNAFVAIRHPETVAARLPLSLANPGGSLWLRRVKKAGPPPAG
jgi:hypothetical protein